MVLVAPSLCYYNRTTYAVDTQYKSKQPISYNELNYGQGSLTALKTICRRYATISNIFLFEMEEHHASRNDSIVKLASAAVRDCYCCRILAWSYSVCISMVVLVGDPARIRQPGLSHTYEQWDHDKDGHQYCYGFLEFHSSSGVPFPCGWDRCFMDQHPGIGEGKKQRVLVVGIKKTGGGRFSWLPSVFLVDKKV